MAATMTSPKIVFVCGGEGTTATAPETCLALAKASPTWALCLGALRKAGIEAPGAFVEGALGTHVAPGSPVATTVLNLCLADTWKAWGYEPSISVGHSVGEVAAAYAAGMYTVEEAMAVALELGEAAKKTSEGRMLHTRVAKGARVPPCGRLDAPAWGHAVLVVRTLGRDYRGLKPGKHTA